MHDVNTSGEPGDRLRELRRRRGLTQERLAEMAGLSVQCIKKIEQGGSARMETYRQIANTLGVTTVWFVAPGSPEPVPETGDVALLSDMRAAIAPPVGLSGTPMYGTADGDDVALPRLAGAVSAIAMAYHGNKYDHLAQVLPALIRSAGYHVARFDGGEEHRQAVRLRGDLLGLAGRYLIQVRAHDLALTALQQSVRDALEIGDMPLAASGVGSQAWAMMRQGRFAEVERLCVQAAQQIEPRMSQATAGELSAWGWLLLRAAAAAVRNNRTAEARELLTLADTAGTRMEREQQDLEGHKTFGPISVALMRAETEMIAGEPGRALEVMANLPRGIGRPSTSTWNRGQLEKAQALVDVGDADQATEVLASLKAKAPEWLRYQQRARDIADDILRARTRLPTAEQREIADFLRVKQ
ncbi:helix-turn-helix domain-containing protein [Bailinhaonella thermotolerans]|uniref:XRE family transcriptional regulator n=1 Tax=Bailinhaonella thermotolerans TaxID=1070861 RepID=A0A3A4APY4_9ACTN|nr:helix-turn-helix transcriptional regulator [Bailinhaonella thermotolerans]RJL31746.1 XRE family transcriptional regulator [Bailinhaonella thermotolerans]